ncbi:MAG TPA: hypothetical protein VF103_05935 [Polyangiaceae bacterium]
MFGAASCASNDGSVIDEPVGKVKSAAELAPILAASSVPRFATTMPRLPTYEPTLVRNAQGQLIRKEWTVRMAKFTEQQLPSGFPATPLFGYGGNARVNGGPVQFVRTSPGPSFEQTRGVPDITH